MTPKGTLRRDVTDLFNQSAVQEPSLAVGPLEGAAVEEGATAPRPLPLPDPLGLLERLSCGRVRDPVRHWALDRIEDVRSYVESSGNRP